MALHDILQHESPPVTEFAFPDGLMPGFDGAILICQFPTPRRLLDINASPTKGMDGEVELLRELVLEIRLADEVVKFGDLDPEQLPLPVFRFLSAACAALLSHGVQQSGEVLRAWRAQRSTEGLLGTGSSTL